MSEQPPEPPADRPERPDEGHPIAAGLIALVGVGVVVGLILGLVVFAGTKVVGLGGDDSASDAGDGYTLVVPKPQKTTGSSGPEITLAPSESDATSSSTRKSRPSKSASPDLEISLSASTTSAGPMEPFNLSGVYPGGEGAILQVQRFEGGRWANFNATGSVSGEQFQIPIQTSQPGVNRFRVVDTDSGLESGEAKITIG
ncbi:hypothetical protein [Nocardioides mangrovi]|uniref:Bacterial spore germination immunoglobulin-like domain-containing protein n=1 Tax=Nocardioides mangrovi TaxID=2874580 RepID=A0ABS7UBP8_9ACTN|nr:hypothetical protein [Nocardioides mangrovi]MBZ5738292.1 hypothetical protein [Nocardioides mangrovi]